MRKAIWCSLAAFILGLPACGGKEDGSPLDSIPDAAALTLEVTGGSAETGAQPVAAQLAAPAEATVTAGTTWPVVGDDLAEAQKKIAAVNAAIRNVFEHVAGVALVNGAPWPGTGKWYGPADRCTVDVSPCPEGDAATFRLWIGNAVGRGGAFVLQAKAVGSTDGAYRTILAGWMRRGALPRRGIGQMWVNLGNLKLAAPAFAGDGTLYAGFAAEGAAPRLAKAETLVLNAFTPDADTWPAATVALRGFRTRAGTARVRVASASPDYVAGTADELLLAHVVYNPDLGGRAYAVVALGDVPPSSYFLGRACYAPHDPSAPIYEEWFLCSTSVGPAACILDAGGAGAPAAGFSGTWPSTCTVTGAFAPPESETASATAVPGPLPGESDTALVPEDPPATQDGAPTPE